MKPFFKFAMLALVLVVVALVSALTAMRFAIHGQVVEVPVVVGLTPLEAERSVAGLGLQIEVERQYYSPQILEGRIMTQLPLPGTKVRRGWQVRVAQSMGPQRVAIPDVTKQSERAAEWNQVAAPRTSLLVTVAADPPAYVMANFVGQPLGTASRTLQDAGFKLGTVSMAPPPADNAEIPGVPPVVPPAASEPAPASTIVTQWPPAGQKVLSGAVINFEVR
jgi:beta-lactam-binding protein with PASTA domain